MAQPHHIARRNNTGFTLLELLVALALMGMLAAWGLPSFQALGERSAVASEVNRLQTALTLARNTAITRRSYATLCPVNNTRTACISDTDDWSGELVVFAGTQEGDIPEEDIVRFFPPTTGARTRSATLASDSQITYSALSRTRNRRLHICPSQSSEGQQGKEIVIFMAGRARVDEDPISCSN
ncbi:GspH/FimT family pseudopilin [Halomonas aquamarina]|uniref:GspH/FimT family pseudopilin n=1 Tax=Vreelandella aquamarina TaxID=77097 RepID=UPI0023583012|nr:GspH/FimT family pseudopilin [Halomonas aquamarina]MDC8444038.1 GspH/FimT family pseudopilin [Halomonas aquamarina]